MSIISRSAHRMAEHFTFYKEATLTMTIDKEFSGAASKLANDALYSMHDAAKRGDAKRLEELLATGMDVDAPTRWGITPLLLASEAGQVECVKVLIAHNANLNATNRTTHTPFMLAIRNGHHECADLLKKAGADTEAKTFYGYKAGDLAPKA